jgi:hypothetical protein
MHTKPGSHYGLGCLVGGGGQFRAEQPRTDKFHLLFNQCIYLFIIYLTALYQ